MENEEYYDLYDEAFGLRPNAVDLMDYVIDKKTNDSVQYKHEVLRRVADIESITPFVEDGETRFLVKVNDSHSIVMDKWLGMRDAIACAVTGTMTELKAILGIFHSYKLKSEDEYTLVCINNGNDNGIYLERMSVNGYN